MPHAIQFTYQWTYWKVDILMPRSCDLSSLHYFLWGWRLELMSTQKNLLQLTHCKTALWHLFERSRSKCRKEYAEIGQRGWMNWGTVAVNIYIKIIFKLLFIYFFVGKTKDFKKEIFRKFIARLKVHICVVHETFHLNHTLAPHNS